MARNKSKRGALQREFLPWIEKYRPRKIDDIAHQSHVVSTLKNSIQSANLTHLLFYGPPGTGKTSTILALCRQLYGPRLMKSRVLELNASDERGINVVRTKIKSFAQHTVNKGAKERGFPCPPYKIVILDEADSMTRDAQTALRRTMERFSNITRFCLICNYVSRIIAPVASRCSKFRFQLLAKDSMMGKLTEIAQSEQLNIAEDVLAEIIKMSGGDLRKSITVMQSASLMKGRGEAIDIADVHTVNVRVPDHVVWDFIIRPCSVGSFGAINDAAHRVMAEGYPVSLILPLLVDAVMGDDSLFTNLAKADVVVEIAEADKKLVDGASEFLQLLNVMGALQRNLTKGAVVKGTAAGNDNNNNDHDTIDID